MIINYTCERERVCSEACLSELFRVVLALQFESFGYTKTRCIVSFMGKIIDRPGVQKSLGRRRRSL